MDKIQVRRRCISKFRRNVALEQIVGKIHVDRAFGRHDLDVSQFRRDAAGQLVMRKVQIFQSGMTPGSPPSSGGLLPPKEFQDKSR